MPTGAVAAELLPVLIAAPILVACLLVAVGGRLPHALVDAVGTGTALAVTGLAAAVLAAARHGRVVTWSGGWQPVRGQSVGIPLVADATSAGLAVLIGALGTCALLFSVRYYPSVRGWFDALMLLFLAGMEGFALSGDIFDMFVFFELMGAVAYALTGIKIEDSTAVQGGLNFGVVNSFGAYLSLAGVGMLYAREGRLGLPQLGAALARQHGGALTAAAFTVVVVGFLVKAAVVPFHFWLADAHAVAPAPVCVLFSGVMVPLGLYGVARVYWTVFSGPVPAAGVRRAFLAAGALTAVVGAVMSFAQRHLKRLLAYSTIAHVGLFTMGFGSLRADGTAGAALYVVGHAGVKSALFLLAGILLDTYGTVDELHLYERARGDRVAGLLFLLAALGLAGLPPFATALGKSMAEDGVAAAGYGWGPPLFVAVSALTGGAVLRAGARIYLGWGPRPRPEGPDSGERTSGSAERPDTELLSRTPATMLAAVALLVAGAAAVGLLPTTAEAFGYAGSTFTDPAGYLRQTLFHAPAVRPPGKVPDGWTPDGVGLDVLSAALAAAAACLALWAPRLPAGLRAVAGPVLPAVAALRRLHSGHVGDYIAWLLLGVAGIAGLVGLPSR